MTCLPLWNVCSTSPCPWVLSTRWSDRSSYDSYAADPQQAGWVYYVFSTHTLCPRSVHCLRDPRAPSPRRRHVHALTRNRDGLARALIHFTTLAHPIHGVGWAELLFIVGSETKDHRNLERMRERVTEIRTEPPTSLHALRPRWPWFANSGNPKSRRAMRKSMDSFTGFTSP
jgi:hypothetical protein